MYEINGERLSSSEYELLKSFVDRYDRGEAWDGYQSIYDSDYADGSIREAFFFLQKRGFIKGEIYGDGKIKVTGFPQKGLDFIHDYEKHVLAIAKAEKARRRHEYGVSIAGAIVGAISGAILGFFGGIYSDEIATFISSLIQL